MIEIVSGEVQLVWLPMKPGVTIYMGSLVAIDFSALDEGVLCRPKGVGVSNTTNKDIPMGIAVGNNRRVPVFSSTYKAEYITDPGATGVRADTTEYVGVDGPWAKGEKRAMVHVALIKPGMTLRAPLKVGAIGTALSVLTSTTGNANGLTVTTNACDFTPVADICTIYCRTGQNAGTYRITDDTSTTVAAWDVQMQKTTVTAGETYVRVPLRHHGISYVTFGDSTDASFIDCAIQPVTNYDIIHVSRLDLSRAGHEFVEFTFDQDAFCQVRA